MTIKREISTITDANFSSQVKLLIHVTRSNRFRMKSGVYVNSEYWNEKRQCLSIPKKVGAQLRDSLNEQNDRLIEVEKRITEICRIYGDDVKKADVEECLKLTEHYDGTLTKDVLKSLREEAQKQAKETERKRRGDIFKLSVKFIEHKKYCDVRIRHCRVLFRCMERFEKIYMKRIRRKPFTWDIDEVTETDVHNFFDYLAHEHEYRTKFEKYYKNEDLIYHETNKCRHRSTSRKERGENRLVNMRKLFKTFWRWMLKNGHTENDPIKNLNVGVERFGEPWLLTIEERNMILNHDFKDDERLEIQRDIFVFQCLVGCRVGDLMRLTDDNIVGDMLIYTPHKTKDECNSRSARVPLSDTAMGLIKKYHGADMYGRLFPYIAAQNYNYAIKDILAACEITRNVPVRDPLTGETIMKPLNEIASSHMARRTFCGNAYKMVADPSLIGKMSGHVEGSKAFARYRNIDDDMLRNTINLIQ